MTERDRLIELLLGIYNDNKLPLVFYFTEEEAEFVADKLLENGVIVPPVKVGQTVYRIIADKSVESKITAIERYSDSFWFKVDKYYVFSEKQISYRNNDSRNIYDMLFLTREEAEQALAERSGERCLNG